jgi:hypothetical protein
MSAEVEQGVARQAGGKQATLSQLEMAQARLQVLGGLIQREVLFQRAEREKVLPTEDQITAFINQQKQESGMTDDDFQKNLAATSMTLESLREEARKSIAIKNLQDKYSSKITVNDKEVEDFYNSNRERFVSSRGVALAMIVADPADNSAAGFTSDAKTTLRRSSRSTIFPNSLKVEPILLPSLALRARIRIPMLAAATLVLPPKTI